MLVIFINILVISNRIKFMSKRFMCISISKFPEKQEALSQVCKIGIFKKCAVYIKSFVLTTATLTSFNVFAVNLEEALTSAYTNNDNLQTLRNNFVNEMESFPQALAQYFLPDVSASSSFTNQRSKIKSKLLTSNPPSSQNNSQQNTISVTQPIFNGGSGVAALKAAQEGFKASRANFYDKEQQTLLQLIQLYLNVYETQERNKIAEISLASTKTLLEATQERFKVGEATITDVASAQAAVAKAEADKFVAYANLQAAKSNFAQGFGIEASEVTMPKLPEGLPVSFQDLMQKAEVANPSIGAARYSSAVSKASEYSAKGALLPQVSFSVQASKNSNDPQSDQRLNSISTVSQLSVNIPIYSKGGAQYSAIRRAKNQTRQAAIALDSAIKQNKSSCIAIWEGFTSAKASIASATQGVESATIAYNGMVEEEKVGSKSILDVLNAESQLNSAQITKVAADKNYIFTAYQMKALLGQLTAKSFNLKVNYFSPESEFKKAKLKIIGY